MAHTYHISSFSSLTLITRFDNMNQMRNRIEDDWLNDCLVIYIEGDIFIDIENEKIIQYF
jgi:hypothetical protein